MATPIPFFVLPLFFLVACSQGPAKVPAQASLEKAAIDSSPTPAPTPSMESKSNANSPQEQATVSGEYNRLNPAEAHVILDKGTDRSGPGGYTLTSDAGLYICRQCNAKLYRADDKFESHCGWPSFDDEIEGAVTNVPDADGRRVEIICSNCEGHLGHVFTGERLTPKNTRHCVNTSSMTFVAEGESLPAKIVRR